MGKAVGEKTSEWLLPVGLVGGGFNDPQGIGKKCIIIFILIFKSGDKRQPSGKKGFGDFLGFFGYSVPQTRDFQKIVVSGFLGISKKFYIPSSPSFLFSFSIPF